MYVVPATSAIVVMVSTRVLWVTLRRPRYYAKGDRPSDRVQVRVAVPAVSSAATDSVTAGVSSGSSGFSRLASWLHPSRASKRMK